MCRTALLVAAALGPLASACDTSASAAGLYAPCERDQDCAKGLTCGAGVCTPSDAQAARPLPDADASHGDADDAAASQ